MPPPKQRVLACHHLPRCLWSSPPEPKAFPTVRAAEGVGEEHGEGENLPNRKPPGQARHQGAPNPGWTVDTHAHKYKNIHSHGCKNKDLHSPPPRQRGTEQHNRPTPGDTASSGPDFMFLCQNSSLPCSFAIFLWKSNSFTFVFWCMALVCGLVHYHFMGWFANSFLLLFSC